MKTNQRSAWESLRLKTLHDYDILDTPKDGAFDSITRIASQFLNVPIAIVSLVDEDRIWFKSVQGLPIEETSKAPGLCASAILFDGYFSIEDIKKDPKALANPLIASHFGLEFYAAFPLRTKEGYNLGTFCIMDRQPRILEPFEISFMSDLRDVVMEIIELKFQASKLSRLIYDAISFDLEIN
ncbi:GAF domain-containing protein [Pedobacter rhizosphaerae]|uniref:GAF domain-containing protein n=1 Tax=Pedobacter rhizosphaerae TaxID=390241 RepID=A0A1H9P5E0_9SPHI|nr:GAF domain-containing protein [Pedobacter rhizosphaerae]SER42783.1 GAF domain-containing protein [Pedobacter rhizosphaerae]